METQDNDYIYIKGPKGELAINRKDKLMCKIAMLFEVICLGNSPTNVSLRYGYKKQRFYQILDNYRVSGSNGIIEKKKGPKTNTIRTESVSSQIIRYKFLDPAITSKVIVQKLIQNGISIGLRSVERTIAEYGLQKKTLFLKSEKRTKRN